MLPLSKAEASPPDLISGGTGERGGICAGKYAGRADSGKGRAVFMADALPVLAGILEPQLLHLQENDYLENLCYLHLYQMGCGNLGKIL